MESKGDDALMAELQAGNAGAFDEIMRRYQAQVRSYVASRTPVKSDVDDLVQEAFLRVFRHLWSYTPRGDFRGWLFRIVRNLLIDTLRKNRRSVLAGAGELVDVAVDGGDSADDSGVILDMLHSLPFEQRTAFDLHCIVGLPFEDVAMATGAPVATCKSRVKLARTKLAERLRVREICQKL